MTAVLPQKPFVIRSDLATFPARELPMASRTICTPGQHDLPAASANEVAQIKTKLTIR
jgi:hypothetical protein